MTEHYGVLKRSRSFRRNSHRIPDLMGGPEGFTIRINHQNDFRLELIPG
jgi:hypothetical protein